MKTKEACDCCGKRGVLTKYVTRSFGKGSNVIVIDQIPMKLCPKCGESYFEADTLQEVERLRLHRKSLHAKATAPVVSYV